MTEETKTPKVKILVGYHKPAVLLKDDILTPIHLGRALATQASKDGEMSKEDFEWMCENMIGDDTGDNISHLNRYFCELTGIYWAWKNYDKLGNPDYIGFMHYRRIFDFCSESLNLPISKEFNTPELDYVNNSDKNKYLNQKDIINTILNYNRVISKSQNVNPYLHYKHVGDFLKIKDYDICLNIINEKFNKYSSASKNYNSNSNSYFCNMFIMPKEEFFEYCIFLFGVLFECRKQIDISEYNTVEQRVFGYLGEWICGIFFTYIKIKKYLLKELNVIYIKNYELQQEITPAFKENNIPIIFSCDDNYLSYLAVLLYSIKAHSSKEYNYDICILYNCLNQGNMQKVINFIQDINISVRFINITPYIYQAKKQVYFHTVAHFKESTYYRFFIPLIFKEFQKIIYLDSDIIIQCNLSDLYSIDFDKPLAAAKCMIFSQVKQVDHRITKLKMKQPENYFQAGVMVYNIQKCLNINFTQKCLNKLQELKDPPLVDQDVLNAVFEGDIHYISLKWNCLWNVSYRIPNFKILYSKDFLKDYQEAERDPYIIHYCDYFKPWNSPHLPKADIWWHYARQTPFYEEILFKNITQNSLNINNDRLNKIQNNIHYTPQGAVEKVKTHLSYKLGKEILSIKENKLKVLILLFTLISIY
ncbi:DUF4422 domain-containing protein, partial [Campylobacter jejuni]|nr:DUF4422 domain-containing protein [Campylobacter jejuni]ECK8043054.1 DUF4422 domain-containing protein [Campylobacter jejuni]ECL2835970.1 DUF4422 domain-containing protein [Campylobacter jejuni]